MVLGLLWSNIVFALPKCQGEDVSRWTMCKETYIFKNGDKYVGQFKDGKFHGKGTYIFKNENKYVGDFKNGKFHGKGTYIFTNGDKYVGEFKDGRKNDQGTITYSSGEVAVYDCSNAPYNLSKYPGTCWGDAVWHCLHPNGQGAYDKIQSLPTAGTPGEEGKPYTDGGKQAYELYLKLCKIKEKEEAEEKILREEEQQKQNEATKLYEERTRWLLNLNKEKKKIKEEKQKEEVEKQRQKQKQKVQIQRLIDHKKKIKQRKNNKKVPVYDCSKAPHGSINPGTCWGDSAYQCDSRRPRKDFYDKIQSLPTAGTPGWEGKPYTDGGKQAYELYIKFCQIALQKEIEEEEKQRQKEEIMKPSLYEKIKEQRLKDAHEKLIKKKRKKDQKKQNEEQRLIEEDQQKQNEEQRLREEEQRLREEEQRLREETEQPRLREEEQQKLNKLLPE